MSKIFFSWQSDLPNSDNRNFIEDVIKKSIQELNNIEFSLVLSIDKDTNKLAGSPDISNSILTKINESSAFVADISFINNHNIGRKTPNPNVLFELGYATKHLGWENIICIFNTDYGSIEDLPFDIRNRRILTYSLKENKKSEERKKLIKVFVNILKENEQRMALSKEIIDYYNVDIYNQMVLLLKSISSLLSSDINKGFSLQDITILLSMKSFDIKNLITNKQMLGFCLLKDYSEIEKSLNDSLNKIVQVRYFNDKHYLPLIKLIKILKKWNKLQNRTIDFKDFKKIENIGNDYKVLNNNDIRRVLLKKIEKDLHFIVIDHGDFKKSYLEKDLLNNYIISNEQILEKYHDFITEVIENINQWITLNDGEFLIDNISMELRGKI